MSSNSAKRNWSGFPVEAGTAPAVLRDWNYFVAAPNDSIASVTAFYGIVLCAQICVL